MTDTLTVINNGIVFLLGLLILILLAYFSSIIRLSLPGDTMDLIINGQVSFSMLEIRNCNTFYLEWSISELLSFNIQLSIRSVWQVGIAAQAGILLTLIIFWDEWNSNRWWDGLFDFSRTSSPPSDYLTNFL